MENRPIVGVEGGGGGILVAFGQKPQLSGCGLCGCALNLRSP